MCLRTKLHIRHARAEEEVAGGRLEMAAGGVGDGSGGKADGRGRDGAGGDGDGGDGGGGGRRLHERDLRKPRRHW